MRERGGIPWKVPSIALSIVVFSAAALFAQTAPAVPAEPVSLTITLEQTIERALANQPLIDQALAAVQAARARVGEAQSAYFPNISGSAGYNRIEPSQAYTFDVSSMMDPFITYLGELIKPTALNFPPPPAPAFSPLTLSLFPEDNWDFHLTLAQVVTQFGKRTIQVKLAESGVAAARIGVEQIRTSLAFQAAQSFFTVLFLQEDVRDLDAQLDTLRRHLDVIRVREQTGSATEFEVLATQARLASLESQLTDAQNQLEKQKIGLKLLIGLDPGADVQLSGALAAEDTQGDPQEAISAALERRAEIRQAREAENAAELGTQLAFSSFFPTLSVRGAIGYRNGLLPDINALTFNWMAGVQLNVPIFQGFLTARQADEARERLAAAREGTAAARRSVTLQVLQAAQDLQSARRQVETADRGLEAAKRMVEVAGIQYDLGLITNLEYLDSQTALQAANLARLGALYREVLSEYALRQASGESLAPGGGVVP